MGTNKNPVVSGYNKVGQTIEGAWNQTAKHRRWVFLGLGAVVVIAGGAFLFRHGMPHGGVMDALRHDVATPVASMEKSTGGLFAPATLEELQKDVRQNPKDAKARAQLAQAYFDKGLRQMGVAELNRALNVDPSVANDKLAAELVASYGTNEQVQAENIISSYHLLGAQEGLERLTSNSQYGVRLAALTTLQKLGRVSRNDYFHAWTMDLAPANSCDVRRHAIAKLGELGDKRAIEPIREARKKDDAQTPWYGIKCIGSRSEDAEKKILAEQAKPVDTKKPATAVARK